MSATFSKTKRFTITHSPCLYTVSSTLRLSVWTSMTMLSVPVNFWTRHDLQLVRIGLGSRLIDQLSALDGCTLELTALADIVLECGSGSGCPTADETAPSALEKLRNVPVQESEVLFLLFI